MDVIDLRGIAYANLPNRLVTQSFTVEKDGWPSAARLMRNAAYILLDLHDRGVINLELEDES